MLKNIKVTSLNDEIPNRHNQITPEFLKLPANLIIKPTYVRKLLRLPTDLIKPNCNNLTIKHNNLLNVIY